MEINHCDSERGNKILKIIALEVKTVLFMTVLCNYICTSPDFQVI